MCRAEGGDATVTAPRTGPDTIHDILGIGFGPANLALAIAIGEHNARVPASRRINARFLERQPRFGWHRGMLIDDATMQVSFLKDLVTMRDPTSDFSFLCYLRERGRLVDFLNQKTLFPLRVEFHDYFEWAAARVADVVDYSSHVLSVTPVRGADGGVEHLEIAPDVWLAGARRRTLVVHAAPAVVRVELDPDHRFPDVDRSNDVWTAAAGVETGGH
jgi:L-ornithine N5-oxygenase